MPLTTQRTHFSFIKPKWVGLMLCIGLGILVAPLSFSCAQATDLPPPLDDLAADWIPASSIESPPSVNNFSGGLRVGKNVLGITSLAFPPYVQGGDKTDEAEGICSLSINGKPVLTSKSRWFPYQVMRQATVGDIAVETTVRMVFENNGVLFRIALKNGGAQAQSVDLSIALKAWVRCHDQKWKWGPPRPLAGDGFQGVLADDNRVYVVTDTQTPVPVGDVKSQHPASGKTASTGPASSAFAFEKAPASLTVDQDQGKASWTLSIASGNTETINFVMVIGADANATTSQAQTWAQSFTNQFDEAKGLWEKRWKAAFTQGNGDFSGSAPILSTSDEKLSRVYYMSILSALECERTDLPKGVRCYVSASPVFGVTLEYFWDSSFWSPMAVRLESSHGEGTAEGFSFCGLPQMLRA